MHILVIYTIMYITINQIFDNLNIDYTQKYMQYENEILTIFNSSELNPSLFNLDDPVILHLIALYYDSKNNYDEMIKYYLLATEKKYVDSMYNLAYHYDVNKKSILAVKYFDMAIDHGYEETISSIHITCKNKIDELFHIVDAYNLAVKYNQLDYKQKLQKIKDEFDFFQSIVQKYA